MQNANMNEDIIRMFPVFMQDDGILFFEEDPALEEDSWKISEKCEKAQIFRNRENHVLIAKPEDHADCMAVFERMTDQEMENVSGITFNIHIYKDTKLRGLPVAFSTEYYGKTYIMEIEKTGGQMRVVFREGKVKESIPGETSSMIFFKTQFSYDPQFYMFESSLEQGHFLAFDRDKSSGTTRLTIKRQEATDDTTKLFSSPFPQKNQ